MARAGTPGQLAGFLQGSTDGGGTRTPGARWAPLVAALAGAGLAYAMLAVGPATLAALWWLAVLVVIRSDLDRYIIPDLASLAIGGLGIVQALAGAWPDGGGAVVEAAGMAALRAATAFAVFAAVAWAYRRRRGREGLGFGDVKLAAASAAWLDFPAQVAALEIACVAAIAMVLLARRRGGARDAAIPFGAFLAPAAWLAFVAGPAVQGLVGRAG